MNSTQEKPMRDEEISAPVDATPAKPSFTKRLRAALESLEEGKSIKLRTKEDRQTVTNAVLAVKKKMGYNLTTHLLQGRDDLGRMVIEITRKPQQ